MKNGDLDWWNRLYGEDPVCTPVDDANKYPVFPAGSLNDGNLQGYPQLWFHSYGWSVCFRRENVACH